MQINIRGHHVEMTDPLKQYVTDKLQGVQKRFNNITSVNVILTVDKKYQQKAEATLHLAKGELYAEAEDRDMYAAIDALTDKLEKQVTKHKEKMAHHGDGKDILL